MRTLDIGSNHGLQTTQISWLNVTGKLRTNFARAPRAAKTGDEAKEIWGFWRRNGNLPAIGEGHKMRLNLAYFLEELQLIQGTGHLAQFDFRASGMLSA